MDHKNVNKCSQSNNFSIGRQF